MQSRVMYTPQNDINTSIVFFKLDNSSTKCALHTYMFIHVQFAFSESNLVEKEVGKNEDNLSCQSHIVYIGRTEHVKVQIACINIQYNYIYTTIV